MRRYDILSLPRGDANYLHIAPISNPNGWHLPTLREKPAVCLAHQSGPLQASRGLYIASLQNFLFRSIANALMFRAFRHSAGMLLFACAAAFKTVCTVVVFPAAFAGCAGGVVINSRILGHG